MSINNLSPINQKYIEQNKKNETNQQPNINIAQQPDTVTFGGKQVVRNTGIGALVGGILSGFFKYKDRQKYYSDYIVNNLTNKEIYKRKEEISSKFYDEMKVLLEKAKTGAELTSEEKQLLDDLGYNCPMIKFFDKKLKDSFYELHDKNSVVSNTMSEVGNRNLLYTKGGMGELLGSAKTMLKSRMVDYLTGKKEYPDNNEFFDLLGDGFKAELEDTANKEKARAVAALRMESKFSGTDYKLDEKGLFTMCFDNECKLTKEAKDGFEKAFSGLPGHIDSYIEQMNKKYGAELATIETDSKNLINNQIKNDCLKSATKTAKIGALIVGGIALIGSLIYKAIKNKNVEQNK